MAKIGAHAELLQAAGGVVPPPRQAELLPAEPAPAVEARKPGRPLGARGKRTEEFRRELEELGPLPGIRMAQLIRDYFADPRELGIRLGVDAKTLFEKVVSMLETIMPYTEQKMPIAAEINGKGFVGFTMVDPLALVGEAGDAPGTLRLGGMLLDQGVSTDADGGVGQPGVGQDEPSA